MSRWAPHICRVLLGIVVQTTMMTAQQPTGMIAGAVVDPSGAAVPQASVNVAQPQSGFTTTLSTSAAGLYSAADLRPGEYQVRVAAPGFAAALHKVTVRVGQETRLNFQLRINSVSESVTVHAPTTGVSPAATSLDGIVPRELILDLPLNGRNFLDLGQLEPGVQVQPENMFFSRAGFVRLSIASQGGATTRVTVDGLSINDEHMGSIAQNISMNSIQEFQISRSTPDISTGLTGSGAVNIVTNSGSNDIRGDAYVFWRDARISARLAQEQTPFDREQAGFSLGGPLLRDRVFWYASYERSNQDAAVVTNIAPFPLFSRAWPSESDERMAMGRVDANLTRSLRAFVRFTHDWNTGIPGRTFGGVKLAPVRASNNSNQSALGIDAVAGRSTHAVRFGYTNYDNLADTAPDLIPGLPRTVDPRSRPLSVLQAAGGGAIMSGNAILIGTHTNIPVRRFQDTYEVRYDGSFSFGRHALRWGAAAAIIRVNWFESLNGRAPQVNIRITDATVATCGSDILCYPVGNVLIGNGLGYWTETPSHGLPYGGIGNNRVHWYVGDSWRPNPRLTLNYGLRWIHEPGPNNPDLHKPTILETFMPGLSRPNPTDGNNFAPQLGIAWSATDRWVVRGGAGVFFDANLLKHVALERSNLLPPGITSDFRGAMLRDPNTNRVIFDIQGRKWLPPEGPALITPGVNWVGQPLGTPGLLDAVFEAQAAFRSAYQIAYDNFPSGPTQCELSRTCSTFSPDYQTPYAIHFNVGVQRELRSNLALSADYVRTRTLHTLMRHNANRNGAADTLDVQRALAAMNMVQLSRNCATGPAGVDCAIAAGATLISYANAGLSSSATASISGASKAAFPGLNPDFNSVSVYDTNGFSTYNALQVQLRGKLPNLRSLLKDTSIIASYSLSRMEGTAEDIAIVNLEERVDNDDPGAFRGPTAMDRTHMFSAAAMFTIAGGVRLSSTWRAYSALPLTLNVPQVNGGGAEIFFTDFNGDGTGQDVLPGSNRGSYGRDIGCGATALNRVIGVYNSTHAGRLTPAGTALVSAGLFNESQLVRLGAVSPSVSLAPAGQVCLDSFFTTDLRISRVLKLSHERITIEPMLEWFNLFNIANYDLPDNKLSGSLDATVGSVNGTTAGERTSRAGGTGSFVLGAPRSWQLGVRISF